MTFGMSGALPGFRVAGFAPVALALAACTRPPVVPVVHNELLVHADAVGDVAHPVEVLLVAQKATVHIRPGSAGGPLVEGSIRSEDATLVPHVTTNARGVAVVQDFTPDAASARVSWDLALGDVPMRLSIHTLASEQQHLDLGGRAVETARVYNEGGRLDLDWSAPNATVASRVELWSIGYLDARNLDRARAKHVELKNVGFAMVDWGAHVSQDLDLEVVESAGDLVLIVPADATASVTLDVSPKLHVRNEGWRQELASSYTLGHSESPPRVTIVVHGATGTLQLLTTRPAPS
jgi:hypothetical protein